ncbi:MAG: 30S ribosomal protein S6 [Clostridia bacterium]|jgi:small subunit ribosomal protein S6
MNKYEALYIIDPSLEEEARKAVIERFSELVTSNGGTVDEIDEWGNRRLAYPINDLNEGYYVLMHFTAEPDFPRELERNYRISDDILRYLITKLDK